MGVLEEASCNVGKENALWILIIAIFGPFHIILAPLVAGKSGSALTPYLKWTAICMILMLIFGLGWILSLIIGVVTYSNSTK